ncbi:hypothetical protein [Chamaesiphon minutus]|uniref:hypothetical protein n=1 Tax=Chamaesiphon minutus TaxID=1173032 RepID=UPI00031AF77D|nr:hypothetical protein [Chamaesiphon minutus]
MTRNSLASFYYLFDKSLIFLTCHECPGYGSLSAGVRSGEITAKDLVKAAIDSKLLPPQAIADRSYLGYVDLQLKSMKF